MKPIDYIAERYPDLIVFEGLDDCILGIAWIFNTPIVAYDRQKVLTTFSETLDVGMEEAEEYYSYNVSGAYIGENTPAFIEYIEEAADE